MSNQFLSLALDVTEKTQVTPSDVQKALMDITKDNKRSYSLWYEKIKRISFDRVVYLWSDMLMTMMDDINSDGFILDINPALKEESPGFCMINSCCWEMMNNNIRITRNPAASLSCFLSCGNGHSYMQGHLHCRDDVWILQDKGILQNKKLSDEDMFMTNARISFLMKSEGETSPPLLSEIHGQDIYWDTSFHPRLYCFVNTATNTHVWDTDLAGLMLSLWTGNDTEEVYCYFRQEALHQQSKYQKKLLFKGTNVNPDYLSRPDVIYLLSNTKGKKRIGRKLRNSYDEQMLTPHWIYQKMFVSLVEDYIQFLNTKLRDYWSEIMTMIFQDLQDEGKISSETAFDEQLVFQAVNSPYPLAAPEGPFRCLFIRDILANETTDCTEISIMADMSESIDKDGTFILSPPKEIKTLNFKLRVYQKFVQLLIKRTIPWMSFQLA